MKTHASKPSRRNIKFIALMIACVIGCAGFTALGIWQVHRLSWKLDLIARVDARIHQTPTPLPPRDQWPQIDASHDEYRRIEAQGHFLEQTDTRVQALTELGSGYWVLSAFALDDGGIVLINRGFIPIDWREKIPSSNATHIIGLLRMSEPRGQLFRRNDSEHGRWFSRDIDAIATARGLHNVAPFFIDEELAAGAIDAEPAAGAIAAASTAEAINANPAPTAINSAVSSWPRAGLTVTHFHNNHLGYALTWFALALMCAGAAIYLIREECRNRSNSSQYR